MMLQQPRDVQPQQRTAVLAFIALMVSIALLAACGGEPDLEASRQIDMPTISATAEPAGEPSPPTTAPPEPSPTWTSEPTPTPEVALYGYRVVATYPHDPDAFTQGLVYVDGVIYEGTGLYGRSSLRKVDLVTGDVLESLALPDEFFGEGITVFDDRIYQITWKSGTAFVYDLATFELLEELTYPTEGWGITHDGEHLITSDGTNKLYFRDPETFEELGRIEVHDEGGPVTMLNELEYIEGEVWANVWMTDTIVRIDPETGRVTGQIDLSGLLDPDQRQGMDDDDVLNGIAWDEDHQRLFVTGKRWPTLFEIELVPR